MKTIQSLYVTSVENYVFYCCGCGCGCGRGSMSDGQFAVKVKCALYSNMCRKCMAILGRSLYDCNIGLCHGVKSGPGAGGGSLP